jgi:hypothetical protein
MNRVRKTQRRNNDAPRGMTRYGQRKHRQERMRRDQERGRSSARCSCPSATPPWGIAGPAGVVTWRRPVPSRAGCWMSVAVPESTSSWRRVRARGHGVVHACETQRESSRALVTALPSRPASLSLTLTLAIKHLHYPFYPPVIECRSGGASRNSSLRVSDPPATGTEHRSQYLDELCGLNSRSACRASTSDK